MRVKGYMRRIMRRHWLVCMLLAGCMLFTACGESGQAVPEQNPLAGKTFAWEKGGFGSTFTISLHEDETYSYYAGVLSSYVGFGTWKLEGDQLSMREDAERCGYSNVFHFTVTKEGLVFQKFTSSQFMYVTVEDGDRFTEIDPADVVFVPIVPASIDVSSETTDPESEAKLDENGDPKPSDPSGSETAQIDPVAEDPAGVDATEDPEPEEPFVAATYPAKEPLPIPQDEDGNKMYHWALVAAQRAIGNYSGSLFSDQIVITDIRSKELGMASAGTATASESIEIYEAHYHFYLSDAYQSQNIIRQVLNIARLDRTEDGGFLPADAKGRALFAVYSYDDGELSYRAFAGRFSEADIPKPAAGDDPLQPYRTVAGEKMAEIKALIAQSTPYGSGPDHWADFELKDPEVCVYFGEDGPYGPGTADVIESFDPTTRKEVWLDKGYADGDAYFSVSHPGVQLTSYFSALSGQMHIESLRTTAGNAHTPQGIYVGSSREEVESLYPEYLHGEPPWQHFEGMSEDCYYTEREAGWGATLVFRMENDVVAEIFVYNMFN